MFRKLLIFFLAAIACIIMLIPIIQVFTCLWDILTGAIAALLMILMLMGMYIERIRAFVRGNPK